MKSVYREALCFQESHLSSFQGVSQEKFFCLRSPKTETSWDRKVIAFGLEEISTGTGLITIYNCQSNLTEYDNPRILRNHFKER